eukprot:13671944-Ditylum_brightwellii.AAC.1
MHHIGHGPKHMEQLVAWIDHPWKSMKHCFRKTEDMLGELFVVIAKVLMIANIIVEKEQTMLYSKTIFHDKYRNIGLTRSVDMHWPIRRSGCSYNSDPGASYAVGLFLQLVIATWVFPKTCRKCSEFLKQHRASMDKEERVKPS